MLAMEDQQIRAALDQHWAASAAGDLEKGTRHLWWSRRCRYPQSREHIVSRRNIQALRGHHPSKPGEWLVMETYGPPSMWSSMTGRSFFMEFRDGKVIHETQYFAEPFQPPASRARWVERMTWACWLSSLASH